MIPKTLLPVALSAVVVLLYVSQARADNPPPQWLQAAATQSTPTYDVKDVPAIVLLNEESVRVESNGNVTRTVRYAVRILVREGREYAIAHAVYETDAEKVRDIDAWLIRRTGTHRSYGKKEALDIALAENDLYNEARVRLISAKDIADEGDVFGYEAVTESKSIFSQFQFQFQQRLPVLTSQFQLDLPAGWRAESVTFNKDKVEPVVNGTTYSWQLRDLQPIRYEAGSPNTSSISPRLAVSFFPPQGAGAQFQTFTNWSDVARWMSEIEDPQMTIDDALAAKAHELSDNAKSELDKIRAISQYVQQVQYISIQIGVGRGGGYRPHYSTDVFAKSYGDCKDKANLMRAMLNVLKIQSYLVSITADDPNYVRAEWASPHQFNHCIIAIKVSDATIAPSIVTHPVLGRLLIFDPTSQYTLIGDLPEEEQGSYALIDHKTTDSLTKMPVMPAETNRLDRTVDITLGTTGEISGKVNEKSTGQSAAGERARLHSLSLTGYNSMIENWISRGAVGAKTAKIVPTDDHDAGSFDLDVEFSANSYAQIMQGKLMVFKPAIVGRLERLSFTEGKRMQPYMIDATYYSETVRFKLPQGFSVDETPDAVKLDTDFGKYEVKYEVKGDQLIFTRSLKLTRSSIPADKYDSIRKFFGSVRSAEQSQVVLIKK